MKAVWESVQQTLRYLDVNANGSHCLLEAIDSHGCHTLVFSCSTTLYRYRDAVAIPGTAPIAPINHYGPTKAAVEQILADLQSSAPKRWRIACLCDFNPFGAHPSCRIGEDPRGITNNHFPVCGPTGHWPQTKRCVISGGSRTNPKTPSGYRYRLGEPTQSLPTKPVKSPGELIPSTHGHLHTISEVVEQCCCAADTLAVEPSIACRAS